MNKKKIINLTFILTLVLLLTLISKHANSQWIPTNGPGGGTVLSLAISGNNLFAGRADEGVARSANYGNNWSQTGMTSGTVISLFFNGNYFFAGSLDFVSLSTDNGANWIQILNQCAYDFAVKDNLLFAGTTNGVYLSTNNGTNWIQTSLTRLVYAIAVNGDILFTGTNEGVFLSTNNGAIWTPANNGLTNQDIHALEVIGNNLFAGTGGGGVYLSTNNGSDWTPVNYNLNTDLWITSFAVKGDSLFAGTTNGGIFLSTNFGASWSQTGLTDQYVRCIAVSGENLFAGTYGYGLFHSTNSGTSWFLTGLTDERIQVLGATGNNIFAGTFDVLYRTTNEGADWALTGLRDCNVWALAFRGNNIFSGSINGVEYGGIFRSTDNGTSWIQCKTIDVRSLEVMGNIIFAGTWGHGVCRSTDNGENWIQINNGMGNQDVWALAASDENIFAGTASGGVFFSADSGSNWVPVNFGLTNLVILALAINGDKVFAGTDGAGVFISTNNGTSWLNVNNGLTNFSVRAFAMIGNSIFAATDGGVFHSTNNGLIWQELNDGFGTFFLYPIFSLTISEDYIYCGTNNQGVWRRNLSDITVNTFCGPGSHFVDNCSSGTDSLDIAHNCETKAMIRISLDTSDNCNVLSVPLPMFSGPTLIRRGDPKDTSGRFPGVAQIDGHNDIIETEMLEMNLKTIVESNGDTAFLNIIAGMGRGTGPCGSSLNASYGYIHELPSYNNYAESFFDVFFELCIEDPHGIIGPPNPRYYLYNLMPVGMKATIDQIPPKCGRDPNTNEYYTVYKPDPNTCSKLYASCIPGTGNPPLAKIVHVEHALPVELASFSSSATGNDVVLNWTTFKEINNSGFAIERSSDRNWNEIGFVTGKGSNNSMNFYEFTDKNLASGIYQYRLKQIDFNGNFEYFDLPEAVTIGVPDKYFFDQNYPNPFNPHTTIAYGIPQSGNVTLKIFDMTGREVKTLVNEFKDAGYYVAMFDGSSLASGTYFCRIESGSFVSSRKMVLVK